jgi:hypothetical protein
MAEDNGRYAYSEFISSAFEFAGLNTAVKGL